jgi:hypothetical protein
MLSFDSILIIRTCFISLNVYVCVNVIVLFVGNVQYSDISLHG